MLPKNLLYQTKAESAQARSYKSNLAPQNGLGPYKANETIIFNIPTASNLVTAMSENYLKFDLKFTNGGTALDYARMENCGAHAFIQRVRIFHGSVLLEDINNYNQLASMCFDLQVNTPAAYGKYNILSGSRSDFITTTPTIAANAAAADIVTGISAKHLSTVQVNSGISLIDAQLATNTEAPKTFTFCLNLISLVGTLCPKYFPLFECTSAPLRVEIQLVSAAKLAICTDQILKEFSLSNVEYVMNCIELSDSAIATIRNSTEGNPLQFVFSDYSNIETSYSASSGSILAVPMSFKYASIRSLFIAMRDRAKTDIAEYFPFSNNTFNLQSYSFRIGSQVVPTKQPENYVEMFAELIKSIASLSDLNHSPSIELRSYSGGLYTASTAANDAAQLPTACGVTTADNVNSGSFYIGLDLENYPNSDKDRIFAGYNSKNDDIFFMPKFGALTAATNISFGMYCMFDSLLTFQNGQAYVSF